MKISPTLLSSIAPLSFRDDFQILSRYKFHSLYHTIKLLPRKVKALFNGICMFAKTTICITENVI